MVFREVQVRPRSLRPPPEFYSQPAPENPVSLTDLFAETTMKVVRSAIDDGTFDDDQVDEFMGRLPVDEMVEQIWPGIERGLIRTLPPLIRSLRGGERRIATYLDSIWGPADRLFQAFTHVSYEIGQAISTYKGHSLLTEALLGLHARACRVAAEVRLCAMNGFAAGAAARWRSLHELAVVASLLSEHGDELALRYLASSIVERWRDVRAYQEAAPRLNQAPFTEAEVTEWRAEYDAALARHGSQLAKDNGWASTITDDGKAPTFRDLERLAKLDHLRPYYRQGSHNVHAGARAAELGIVVARGEPVRTTGATVFADITETCHGAMISLLQVTTSLISATDDDAVGDRIIDNLVAVKVMMKWLDDAGTRYERCADRAREDGLFTHTPSGTSTPDPSDGAPTDEPGQ